MLLPKLSPIEDQMPFVRMTLKALRKDNTKIALKAVSLSMHINPLQNHVHMHEDVLLQYSRVSSGPEMRGARSSPSASTLALKILLARLFKRLADQRCFF